MKPSYLYFLFRSKAKNPYYVGITHNPVTRKCAHRKSRFEIVYRVRGNFNPVKIEAATIFYLKSIGLDIMNVRVSYFDYQHLKKAEQIYKKYTHL